MKFIHFFFIKSYNCLIFILFSFKQIIFYIIFIFNYKSTIWTRKKNFASLKRLVHSGWQKKIVDLIMSNASSKIHVKTNRNACFIISKNNYLTNQSHKPCVNLARHVIRLDAHLNMKEHLRDHKGRIWRCKRKSHFKVIDQLKYADLDKHVKGQIVNFFILKDKVKPIKSTSSKIERKFNKKIN